MITLKLRSNKIRDDGARAFGETLKINQVCTVGKIIVHSFYNIDDVDAHYSRSGLESN